MKKLFIVVALAIGIGGSAAFLWNRAHQPRSVKAQLAAYTAYTHKLYHSSPNPHWPTTLPHRPGEIVYAKSTRPCPAPIECLPCYGPTKNPKWNNPAWKTVGDEVKALGTVLPFLECGADIYHTRPGDTLANLMQRYGWGLDGMAVYLPNQHKQYQDMNDKPPLDMPLPHGTVISWP